MKTLDIEDTDLLDCVKQAQRGGVVITRNGPPVVVVVGVKGMDREQVELSCSEKFWKMIRKARREKTISRAELEKRLASK